MKLGKFMLLLVSLSASLTGCAVYTPFGSASLDPRGYHGGDWDDDHYEYRHHRHHDDD